MDNTHSSEAQCLCGALLDNGDTGDTAMCRKCTARARWQRRHGARRGHRNPDRRRNGDLG
jgi:hypothetical protein